MKHVDSERLELYASGKLSEEENNEIEQHILVCNECQDALQAEEETIATLRDGLRHTGPSDSDGAGSTTRKSVRLIGPILVRAQNVGRGPDA